MINIFSGEDFGVGKEFFAGREDFLRRLRDIIDAKVILPKDFIHDWFIVGKLGYGKTSLTKVFKDQIPEVTSNSKTMYININFGDIIKGDSFFSKNGSPRSVFYEYLLNQIYHQLESKSFRGKFHHLKKWCGSKVKSLKFPWIGTSTDIDLAPQGTKAYLKGLNKLFRLNKITLDNLIIAFDEINSLEGDQGIKGCSNYCRNLKITGIDEFYKKGKATNIKKIITIVLSPLFKPEDELKQRFEWTRMDNLPELDKLSIENYLSRLEINSYDNLEAIAKSLYFYTGGIPKAFQHLGFDAINIYNSDPENKKKFSANSVKMAFPIGEKFGETRRNILNNLRESIHKVIENSIDHKIVKNISELTTLQDESTGLRLLDKDEWANLICKNIPDDSTAKTISFNKIWNCLLDKGAIRKEGFKYRFTSEMHRKAISKSI